MRYDEFDTLLANETSSLDRRRVIASDTQASATGIIDHPSVNKTACDKTYWERDNGLFDSVVALYDALAGRTTQGSLDILGEVSIQAGATVFDGTVATGALSPASIAVTGASDLGTSAQADEIETGKFLLNDDLSVANTGLFSVEQEVTGQVGTESRIVYEDNGDLFFVRPFDRSEYQSHGSGGGYHFKTGDAATAYLGPLGHLNLGSYHAHDDPDDPSGLTIQNSDQAMTKIKMHTAYSHPNTAVNLRFWAFKRDPLAGAADHDVFLDLHCGDTGAADAKLAFLVDSTEVFSVDGVGAIQADDDIDAGGDINATGALTGADITIGSGSSLAAADFDFHGSIAAEELFANTLIRTRNTGMEAKMTTSTTQALAEFDDASGYLCGFGQCANGSHQPILYATGSHNKLFVQGGQRTTHSHEIILSFPEYATGEKSSIELETDSYMFVEDMVVRIATKSTDLGGTTVGFHKHPIDNTGIDVASSSQTQIDAACEAISGEQLGATVHMWDTDAAAGTPATGYRTFIFDGTNWVEPLS